MKKRQIDSISAIIIVKNGATTIFETLNSLKDFGEVVVLDNGSTDETLTIVRRFPNVKLVQEPFNGFGPTKQRAVWHSSNDWVISLDADETLSDDLARFLLSWEIPADPHRAYKILRRNIFMGKHICNGGWGNDWLIRLFNRQKHNFNDASVHENIETNNSSIVKKLGYPIDHNAVQELSQFLVKIDHYTEIRRRTTNKTYHPSLIFLKGLWAFIHSYVLRRGFMSGWRGLVIAWCNANGVFFKYMKIYADKRSGEPN